MKHFAGHSFGEGGRNHAPVHIGRRELADLFLIPFEMAIKGGGAQSVMTCYHDIDGEPGTGSRWLLTELLRDRWGFAGTVVSDYFAVAFLETRHGVAADRAEASARALHAGLDVELPTSEYFAEGLVEALDRGLIGVDEIDRSARRVLAQKFALGLFEKPYVEVDGAPYVVQGDRDLALEIAEKSLILLRNDGTLPLRPKARIALIGPSADDQMALFGNYNYPATMRWGWDHPIPNTGPPCARRSKPSSAAHMFRSPKAVACCPRSSARSAPTVWGPTCRWRWSIWIAPAFPRPWPLLRPPMSPSSPSATGRDCSRPARWARAAMSTR